MISAKKAKEKVIKSISKRGYIKKIKEHIEDAIDDNYFECTVTITEYDDIDYSLTKTVFHILRYFEYYGYNVIIVNRESKAAVFNIEWHRT